MTDAPALIDLLSGLLADLAAATADGPPRVLPIVHDALTPDRDVIEAVVERFGGVTLNAAEGSAAVVRGDPPPDLIEAVRATCERHGLLVAVDVNDATVTVRALDAGAVNDSLAAVLRLCGLLLGDAARSHALVVLIAPVQGLDDRRQRLVWDLAVRQAPRHLTGEIRVLVPVWEGSVDFDLHLAGEPSLRYAIQSGRFFARRGGEIALTAGVRSILRERDRPLVLFLGAGFSRAARLPLGDTLRDDAIAELLGVPRGSRELHETFRRWVIDRNRLMEGEREMSAQQFGAQLTLERVLREEFRRLRQEGRDNAGSAIVQRLQADCRAALDRLPPGRQALRRLAAALPRLVVVTVNFDRLIEDEMPVEHAVFRDSHEFSAGVAVLEQRLREGGGPLPVVKLHGDIEQPDTMVADVEQTAFGLTDEARAVLDAILGDGPPVPWVWLGCSMRDLDVNEWARTKDGRRDMVEWWVDPLPGRSLNAYFERFRRKNSEERDIDFVRERLLYETGDRFLAALADLAEELPND